jgi:transketolase
MRQAVGEAISGLMEKNKKIMILHADVGPENRDEIERKFGDRNFNFGIAESNMVAAAAAMAKEGFIPVVFSHCSFLVYRVLEFLRLDICLQNRNVKLAGMGCGVIQNKYGPTHHTLEDIAALRALPNLMLLSPASAKEVFPVIEKAVDYDGPVFIRLGKAFETEIYENASPFKIGKANIIQTGNDITIVATGSIIADAIEAAKMLQNENISVEIINMSTIKPLDEATILKSANKTKRVLTVEEHNIYGGLGGAVSECLLKAGAPLKGFDIMGFNDTFCTKYGWHRDIKRIYGLSPEHIVERCGKLLGK